jgi:pimeloyl-ACP methyl ester carboxylesterase
MATYVLMHGAGSDSWYWHRVTPLLEARGHDVVAPDLPADDDAAGLAQYTDVVVEAIGPHRDLILVAQSMAGFTAPLVAARLPVDLIVLVAAMVPRPGESPGEWWQNTGHEVAPPDDADPGADPWDPVRLFLHDLPPDLRAEAMTHGRDQSNTPFERPWPLEAWPDVPTRFLLCRDDRFFPAEFQRRVVKDRLGIIPDEMGGGHLPALAHPGELVERLESYRTELVGTGV